MVIVLRSDSSDPILRQDTALTRPFVYVNINGEFRQFNAVGKLLWTSIRGGGGGIGEVRKATC